VAKEETIHFKSETHPTFTERGFQPILERLCSVLEKQDLQPIDTLQGRSLKPLTDGVDKPFFKGSFIPFKMEKCEKLALGSFLIMDKILVTALTAIPLDDYELPMLALEWSETESLISILVDFIPVVDLVMREGYCERYLDPLEKYWSKYKDLPGIALNPFRWARAIMGPYQLSGNIPKESEENISGGLELFQNYLEVWINLWQSAEPIKDNKVKEEVKIRKARIRRMFVENDEGSKSMGQLIGKDLQELTALCIF